MLFGLISPDDADFLTQVGDVNTAEALTDEHLKEVNDKLVVHSYAEFEEKFKPMGVWLF